MLLKVLFSSIGLIVAYVAIATIQFKRKYPEKGLYLSILNSVLGLAAMFKLGIYKQGKRMDIDVILQEVMKKTKLTDHGNTEVYTMYRKMIASDATQRLTYTNVGYMLARTEFMMIFSRRLRAIDFVKKCPQIKNIPVKSPVFVFGLGRSGTTFLHRLLSLDPQVRSPRLWELIRPVPSLDPSASKAEFAKDRAERAEEIRARIAERTQLGDDGFEKFHEVGHDLPEECLFAMSDEVPLVFHMLFQNLYDIEGFKNAVRGERIEAALAWYKVILQILMYQMGDDQRTEAAKRWVLKCPLHILWLPHLLKVFPDAKLVWAHRHPAPTVTSACALIHAMHNVYYEKECTSLESIGNRLSKAASNILGDAQHYLHDNKVNCAHVLFENLTASPLETVRNIYKQFGWEVSPEYEKILKDYLEENRKQREAVKAKAGRSDKASMHDHKPENFGMTAKQLSEGAYGDYIRAFNITSSK